MQHPTRYLFPQRQCNSCCNIRHSTYSHKDNKIAVATSHTVPIPTQTISFVFKIIGVLLYVWTINREDKTNPILNGPIDKLEFSEKCICLFSCLRVPFCCNRRTAGAQGLALLCSSILKSALNLWVNCKIVSLGICGLIAKLCGRYLWVEKYILHMNT